MESLDSSFTDFIQDTTQYKVPVANITLEIGQTDYPDEKTYFGLRVITQFFLFQ